MISSLSYAETFSRIYVTEDAAGHPVSRRVRSRLPELPYFTVRGKEEIPPEHRNQRTLFLTLPQGTFVGRCPGTKGHLCCNYITIDLYMGCLLECSYCIMKHYLNFEPITVYVDTAPGIAAVRELAARNPDRAVRVGTGEVGDSLLFDPLCELSAEYIEGLADLPNVHLELKTKTDYVDHLLDIPRKGNAVIGFSVNPPRIVNAEEGTALPLDKRLEAAARAVDAGFRVAFHFDPVFLISGWREAYGAVVRQLSVFPPERVAWISVGTFRYPPKLKERIDDRPYLYDEFVPCRDGKYRYLQKIRTEVYRTIISSIRDAVDAPVYLCMESSDVWKNVFEALPGKIENLCDIFTPVKGVRDHSYEYDLSREKK